MPTRPAIINGAPKANMVRNRGLLKALKVAIRAGADNAERRRSTRLIKNT
ncbi:MAG: hypothetical protein R2818_07810 [Flavobacteriales bacterium]